ncbi:uncharacterized protein LOC142559424 [Dermacentor variabilis]|uniref:uncharacterized protein LOC142559424 n=1 Tax=Dermacentor variabilis TaxID=34621 RepID=UPI003F5C7203
MWHTGFLPSSVRPYRVTVEICGHPISMELHTGASVSALAWKLFKHASPYGVGAILANRDKDGQERSVSFASRRLHAAEQRYGQLNKEGSSLIFGVVRFHQYLWFRKFEAVTYHKTLLGLLVLDKTVPLQALPRVERDLGPADALSHLPLPEVADAITEPAEVFILEHTYPEVLSISAVSQAASRDPALSQVVKVVSHGEELVQQADSYKVAELSLQQGCVLQGSRVVIPRSFRSRVLQLLHIGHPGVEKTKMLDYTVAGGCIGSLFSALDKTALPRGGS